MVILPSPSPPPQRTSISKSRIGRFIKVRPGGYITTQTLQSLQTVGLGLERMLSSRPSVTAEREQEQ